MILHHCENVLFWALYSRGSGGGGGGGGLIKMTGIVVFSLTRYRDCFLGLRLVSFNFKNSIIYKEKTKEINV